MAIFALLEQTSIFTLFWSNTHFYIFEINALFALLSEIIMLVTFSINTFLAFFGTNDKNTHLIHYYYLVLHFYLMYLICIHPWSNIISGYEIEKMEKNIFEFLVPTIGRPIGKCSDSKMRKMWWWSVQDPSILTLPWTRAHVLPTTITTTIHKLWILNRKSKIHRRKTECSNECLICIA